MLCKEAFEKYPFLRPRDLSGELVEYTEAELDERYTTEIPGGWYKLFFQMCEDIKPILEKNNLLDTFYFLQVKEKFNRLCCYSTGSTDEVNAVISKYEAMAYYVCSNCGKPAEAETQGYFISFCNDCWKDFARHDTVRWITFKPYYTITTFENDKWVDKTISFEEEWNRYIRSFN